MNNTLHFDLDHQHFIYSTFVTTARDIANHLIRSLAELKDLQIMGKAEYIRQNTRFPAMHHRVSQSNLQ